MDFETVRLRDGSTAVRASGRIVPGDDERLRAALRGARARPDGWTPLLLSSGGGDVLAALDMATVIAEQNLMPVVPSGAVCDSACASVLFLAGRRSLLVEGGTLFFHACESSMTSLAAVRDCNAEISKAMRELYGVDYEMLLATLDGFAEDETAVSRETRQIAGPVADCLAIDLPPWSARRPSETRCGRGSLLERDPMRARVDTDVTTPPIPEAVPGTVHPVWFLFHWTPPDQWAFWRVQDGVGLGMRPRGVFRNGPELRLFCQLSVFGGRDVRETFLDLRLPADPRLAQARYMTLTTDQSWTSPVAQSERFAEGPLVVAGTWETQRIAAQFDDRLWADLQGHDAQISVALRAGDGRVLWARTYQSHGIRSRAQAAQSNCVGALQPRF